MCILVQNYYEIDIRVRRKAEALVSAGYSVDVLALRSPNSKPGLMVINGVNVYTSAVAKKRGSKLRYTYEYVTFLVWAFLKLSWLMRKRRYRVVDVNTLPDFLIFAAAYAKLNGARMVFDMHEITPEFLMSKYGVGDRHWQVRLARFLEKASIAFADQVITINEPIQTLLESRGLARARSTVVMNSVDESIFATAIHSANGVSPLPPPAPFVMMYHGTLTRIYGLDIAIEALSLVEEEMPGAELWILGSGPARNALEELVRERSLDRRVKFLGAVLPDEIPAWLSQCDVGVLATRRDVFLDYSFSNKLSEYIIMGKGVICSRLNAIRHYFTEEALAYFEPNDPRSLSAQMLRLYRDKELRSRLAARAKQEYAPISWAVMRARYLALIGRMVPDETAVPHCR